MDNVFARTEALIGAEKLNKLRDSHVAVFGIGGVGGYALEALVRSGIGKVTIVDADVVSLSNINRQIIATIDTVGMPKVDAAAKRIAQINPECIVEKHQVFFDEKTVDLFDFATFDYVIDAIDVVSSKILLISSCKNAGTRILSCMGTGNRTVADFKISDVKKTEGCPLARVVRRELKNRGINGVDVLYSPSNSAGIVADCEHGRHAPASICHVPAIAGMMLAGHVINCIAE